MKSMAFSFSALLGAFSAPAPAPMPLASSALTASATQNLSDVFTQTHLEVRAGTAPALPEAARGVRYLFVRGLLGNRTANYFDGNLSRLRALGLDALEIAIDTEGRREGDIHAIEAVVRASPVPVVLIGHSRGGILSHDWYRRATPELKAKIERLVILQSPLQGTALADQNLATRFGRIKIFWIGRLLFGEETFRTAAELMTRVRLRVLSRLPPFTTEDLAKVYAVRGVITDIAAHPYYRASHRALVESGATQNDGRVPAASASIAGAHEIVLRDVDHDNTVIGRPGWFKRLHGARPNPNLDPGDFTEALVRVLFR